MPSTLDALRNPSEIYRDLPERKIAGVCAALAQRLEISITVVRAAFLLLLLPPFHGVGLSLYLILWFLMPFAPGTPSGLDRVLDLCRSLVRPSDRGQREGRLAREDASGDEAADRDEPWDATSHAR